MLLERKHVELELSVAEQVVSVHAAPDEQQLDSSADGYADDQLPPAGPVLKLTSNFLDEPV